jgi:hypothetical protein
VTNSTDVLPKGNKVVKMGFIPEGTTVNNTEGHFIDGSYTIITNPSGDRQIEFSMTLHQPTQNVDWVYMIYLQLMKPMPPELLAT